MMVVMQRRRVAAIGLSAGWLWAWLASMTIGFAAVAYFWLDQS